MLRVLALLAFPASAIQVRNETHLVMPPLFLFGHRKAGEFLASHVLETLAGQFGYQTPFKNVLYNEIQPGLQSHCKGSNLMFYQDMNPLTLDRILHDCPGFKGVHFRRNLFDSLVSNYAYTKNLSVTKDYLAKHVSTEDNYEPLSVVMFGKLLNQLPTREGVLATCTWDNVALDVSTTATYQKIKEEQLPNILQIRFEDFQEDYDGTMKKILEHAFYKVDDASEEKSAKHKLIQKLVGKLAQFDVSRHVDDKLTADHMSDEGVKSEARAVITELTESKHPCVEMKSHNNRALDYA